jgi:hypothetical protein
MELYAIELAPTVDASWIDPVCKMHGPYRGYQKTSGPWFCSQLCADAYERIYGKRPNIGDSLHEFLADRPEHLEVILAPSLAPLD